MIKSYFRIAWRNLIKSKGYTLINVGGLAAGMAVAMLIGLWIWDEVTFDKSFRHHDRIAVMAQNQTLNGSISTWQSMPYPMGEALRSNYGSYFKHVVMASWDFSMILSAGEKKLSKVGKYMEPAATEMLELKMLKGSRQGLKEPGSILLSASTAQAYFGDEDPVGKSMKINSTQPVLVTGVFEDLPRNSSFGSLNFIAPWKLYVSTTPWIKSLENAWGANSFPVYVQIADNVGMEEVSAKIRDLKRKYVPNEELMFNPELFLFPMNRWHLYGEFRDGKNTGGRIEYVWLFGIIGVFVLLLACINFMNLSTARSEKRAREVGVRKAIGSQRSQLVGQFFSESMLVVVLAFICALFLVQLALPIFNTIAGKEMSIPWSNPFFWLLGLCVTLATGLLAGSYPAFYLSSFQPVKVLKGTFRAGRSAALPRQVLVVLQFTVSIVLIIGTIVVFRQVQFAKDRPVGYSRSGLITMSMFTSDIHRHFDAVKTALENAGAIAAMAESGAPVTAYWNSNGDLEWKGKTPGGGVNFPNTGVSFDYGKTVGWQFKAGRDFSKAYASDSSAFVINEAAVKYMGLKDPIGEIIRWNGEPYTVIGVIRDMVVESPYQPSRPALYHIDTSQAAIMNIRINPAKSAREALASISSVFRRYNPEQPFDYRFVDEVYAEKFGDEERIGRLASAFAILAVFISCLGLFGMASFMAERRTKEIGVRKVLGASVFNLWRMLSKDFVILVMISLLIAIPLAWYFMHQWLQHYEYRSGIPWWAFIATSAGTLLLTLLTVSFQSIKAATANPVKSLRAE